MITKINEIVQYTHELSERLHPALRSRTIIEKKECSHDEIDRLRRSMPKMPESYLNIIRETNLDGISIGFLNFGLPVPGGSMIDQIIEWNNEPENEKYEEHKKYHSYEIASYEADPVAVVHTDGEFKKDQIIMYEHDIGWGHRKPVVLADNFEQFLLLFGNLDFVRDKYSVAEDPEKSMQEFRLCLLKFFDESRKDVISNWEKIAEEIFL